MCVGMRLLTLVLLCTVSAFDATCIVSLKTFQSSGCNGEATTVHHIVANNTCAFDEIGGEYVNGLVRGETVTLTYFEDHRCSPDTISAEPTSYGRGLCTELGGGLWATATWADSRDCDPFRQNKQPTVGPGVGKSGPQSDAKPPAAFEPTPFKQAAPCYFSDLYKLHGEAFQEFVCHDVTDGSHVMYDVSTSGPDVPFSVAIFGDAEYTRWLGGERAACVNSDCVRADPSPKWGSYGVSARGGPYHIVLVNAALDTNRELEFDVSISVTPGADAGLSVGDFAITGSPPPSPPGPPPSPPPNPPPSPPNPPNPPPPHPSPPWPPFPPGPPLPPGPPPPPPQPVPPSPPHPPPGPPPSPTPQPPAEGLYVTVRSDALAEVLYMLSLQIAVEANQDKSFPQISGETGQAKYTFSSFSFDINLADMKYSSPGAPVINVEWVSFDFVVTWNYHICARMWPNPCQSGSIEIYTSNSIRLLASLTLSLDGPTVQLAATSISMEYSGADIPIVVTCSDVICLIPTSDIEQAVATSFYSTVTSGLTTAINSAAAKRVNTMPTTFSVPKLGLDLVWTGGFDLVYPSAAPNLLLYLAGEFTGTNKAAPPFAPDFAPPMTVFHKPASEIDIIVTPFMLRSGIWGMFENGRFDVTITSSEVPPKSPIQLNTNSPALKAAAPGFSNYPDMDITLGVTLYNVSEVTITPAGVLVNSTANVTFYVVNSTFSMFAFDIFVELGFVATLETGVVAPRTVNISATVGSFESSVEVIESEIGPVSGPILGSILKLVLAFAPTQLPTESFSLPAEFTLNGVSFTPHDGWADVALNVAYNPSVPGTECSPGGTFCPVGNTCCNWGGQWGCCTLPSAVCCSSGCCASGCSCNGEYCEC